MTSVAKGLAQMRVRLAVLTETKLMDNHHTHLSLGCKVLSVKDGKPQSRGDCPVVEREPPRI